MPAEPRASVVVCTYARERLPLLRRALAAAREQLRAGDELIVVVDHDDALLLDDVRAAVAGPPALVGAGSEPCVLADPGAGAEPRVLADPGAGAEPCVLADPGADAEPRVLANPGARGLSGARDAGVAVATGELVVFLDDDAVPRDGWLERLRAAFADPAVVAAGGAVVADWQTRPAWFPDELGWVVGCDYRGLPDGGPIRNPIGANMAVRRATFERVGGFYGGLGRDHARPLGCEETELAIRIRQAEPGAKIVRVAASAVDHHVPRARATLRYLLRRCWYEGISKGRLARRVGVGDGLASERRYVLRTLSGGAVRHVVAGDLAGPLRAALLVVATAVTSAGFLAGRR